MILLPEPYYWTLLRLLHNQFRSHQIHLNSLNLAHLSWENQLLFLHSVNRINAMRHKLLEFLGDV